MPWLPDFQYEKLMRLSMFCPLAHSPTQDVQGERWGIWPNQLSNSLPIGQNRYSNPNVTPCLCCVHAWLMNEIPHPWGRFRHQNRSYTPSAPLIVLGGGCMVGPDIDRHINDLMVFSLYPTGSSNNLCHVHQLVQVYWALAWRTASSVFGCWC